MTIHPYYFSWQKRFFDLSLAIILLIIGLPILASLTLINLLSIGQPIFYLQKRMGKNRQTFSIIKFRTMQRNAHLLQKKYAHLNQAPAPMFKIYADPRFVGIGKFLSKTGLDELPQLINILKNEMSFVGPRPLPMAENQKLDPSWDFRYAVKPGIFSLWAADDKHNRSLKIWQKLEKETLKKGGTKFELKLIIQILRNQLRQIIKILSIC